MSLISTARLHRIWERLRPLPKARYMSGTPRVADSYPANVFQTPGTMTLAAAAMSEEALSFVEDLIDRLTQSEELAGQQAWLKLSRDQFQLCRHAEVAELRPRRVEEKFARKVQICLEATVCDQEGGHAV